MAGKDYKLELLRGCPLFRGLSKKDLELVGRLADEIDVPAGKMLIKQGASGHEFFIVDRGLARRRARRGPAPDPRVPATSPARSPSSMAASGPPA